MMSWREVVIVIDGKKYIQQTLVVKRGAQKKNASNQRRRRQQQHERRLIYGMGNEVEFNTQNGRFVTLIQTESERNRFFYCSALLLLLLLAQHKKNFQFAFVTFFKSYITTHTIERMGKNDIELIYQQLLYNIVVIDFDWIQRRRKITHFKLHHFYFVMFCVCFVCVSNLKAKKEARKYFLYRFEFEYISNISNDDVSRNI